DRRERGSHRRSGRAADGGHAAPALQPRARNQSHGLSQALLDAGGKRSLTRPALIEASIVPYHIMIASAVGGLTILSGFRYFRNQLAITTDTSGSPTEDSRREPINVLLPCSALGILVRHLS